MDKGTELNHILRLFPGLKADPAFHVTSPCDYDYNCIAWSLQINNAHKWPFPKEYDILDGVNYWPDGLPRNEEPYTFIEMYRMAGYELCENIDTEQDYQKIALYTNANGNITHACRQLSNGTWTSKLGQLNDIQHSSPYSLEGNIYGKVRFILKKKT